MGYPYGQRGNEGFGAHPQPGYAQPGYPQPVGPVRKPGGGTAITAGVLATIQGLLGLALTVVFMFGARADRHEDYDNTSGDVVALIVVATFTGLCLIAAVLLLFRRRAGRYLVGGISGLVLVGGACGVIYTVVVNGLDKQGVVPLMVMVGIVFVIELPTLCLAVASSTGRWIAARTAESTAPGPYSRPASMYSRRQHPRY